MKHWMTYSILLLLSACATAPTTTPPPLLNNQSNITTKAAPHPAIVADTPIVIANTTSIRISTVGDIFMDGTSRPIMQEKGYDYPFQATKHLFAQADVLIGNLEGPLTSRGKGHKDKKYVFRSPAHKVAPALKNAGFNVVTLANNHTMDYDNIGLFNTIDALKQQHIAYIGAGKDLKTARKPHIFEKNGYKVAFLGYSLTFPKEFWAKHDKAGTVFGDEKTIRQDIQAIRQQVDNVVVSFHWGREGTTKLRPYQTRLGRIAIDEGASLVIGHHPHIMQGIERYKNGLILYSLGNYVFGSYSNRTQFGGIANVMLNKSGIQSLELTPIDSNNFRRHFQPIPLQGKRLDQALKSIQALSSMQNTPLAINNGTITLPTTQKD